MLYGYSFLDPLVVISGSLLAIRLIATNPIRLVGFLPAALSLYFFIPTVTLLTLWQIVPMMLIARAFLQGRIAFPASLKPIFALFAFALLISAGYGYFAGNDANRSLLRLVYYLGIMGLMAFGYEMGRRPESYDALVRGFAVIASVYAVYGVYQIIALHFGLPFRGIVYGKDGVGFPVIQGLPRINALANEPKRLGFVLFVGALAFFELAGSGSAHRRKQRIFYGVMTLLVSVLTLSTSYFVAVAMLAVGALVLYPDRAVRILPLIVLVLVVALPIGAQFGLLDIVVQIAESRTSEFTLGTDASIVYRQEFFGQEYIVEHPWRFFGGVGLGQYFSVLFSEFGPGVGYTEAGGLAPFNSVFLEIIYDLGGVLAIMFYALMGTLVLKLKRTGMDFLALTLLFLMLQSISIQTLQFMALVGGIGLGRNTIRRSGPGRR
ncbi:MAG: hypothetical protein Q8O82_05145 [Pseudorhodobacter sp.]|nr:hypothetical protein [Pseudorhodobacter sp.]